MTSARLPVTHEQAVNAILDLARLTGWRSFGVRPARTNQGWRTPYLGDGHGYPDLTLFHARRHIILFIEVKVNCDTLRPEQAEWGQWILATTSDESRVTWHCWHWPGDRAEAELILKGEA